MPGDILCNLFWLYTQPKDLVVDVFAGGGVTLDAVKWWNAQPGLWPLREWSGDLVPSRPSIHRHDASRSPYLPKTCRAAGLIFLDPPYWKQKRGDYSAHETNLANMPLARFNATLLAILKASGQRLRVGGIMALIIGATQDQGKFVDHAAYFQAQAEPAGLELVQRIIVPYTTQQFSAADVAQARKSKFLLKGYRDLMIFRRTT